MAFETDSEKIEDREPQGIKLSETSSHVRSAQVCRECGSSGVFQQAVKGSNIFSFLLVAVLDCAVASGMELRFVVGPGDSGRVPVNPGMGWTLHFYSNLIENLAWRLEQSDTLADWPCQSFIHPRVP